MSFKGGRLSDYHMVNVKSEETGNAISGNINPQLQEDGVDARRLRQWLASLLTASPTLKLFFNGLELHALPQRDAQPL
jgi:hypothetical protein